MKGWWERLRKGTLAYGAAIALLAVSAEILTACSTPTRAKVVSREQPVRKPEVRPPFHRVRKYDTLYSIAWRYGLDFYTLARWNGIKPPYTIYPGQSLRLTRPPLQTSRRGAVVTKRGGGSGSSAKSQRKAPQDSVPAVQKKPDPAPAGDSPTPVYRERLVWQWPAKGVLEQRFDQNDLGSKGIKIRGDRGQPVLAAERGKVVYAGSGLIGYGRLIIIKHNKNYLSAYGHNRKLLVKEGAVVDKGQPIAEMGQKGDGRTLLHFEIRRNGVPIDPLKLLPKRS